MWQISRKKKLEKDDTKKEPDWITVNGVHIPIKPGQNKDDVVKNFLDNQKDKEPKKDTPKTSKTKKDTKDTKNQVKTNYSETDKKFSSLVDSADKFVSDNDLRSELVKKYNIDLSGGFSMRDYLRGAFNHYAIAPVSSDPEKLRNVWEELANKNPEIKKQWNEMKDNVDKSNKLSKELFDNSESFFRGTSIDELDSYLETGKTGIKDRGMKYDFTAVTPDSEIANIYESGVIIEYEGDDVRKHGEPVEYDMFFKKLGTQHETKKNGKMDSYYMDQAEVRMDKTIPLSELKIKSITIKSENKELIDRYSKLGNVVLSKRESIVENSDDIRLVKKYYKKYGKTDGDLNQLAYSLTRWLSWDLEKALNLLKKVSNNQESICPDCGKVEYKEFSFNENLDEHWLNIIQEVRFRAFTHTSSFVGNVRYDQDLQEMTIILNGKEYNFCNVPERKFEAFRGADSKGAYFNRNIRTLHDC